ncbi:MAG: LysM peptidoglycan-binding domain-containing protein, partial [Betaproteobacteria bacterium]|nr:LysM peptidoglycan-binding domain-containing protein [Betaproteobacteria bacterium]
MPSSCSTLLLAGLLLALVSGCGSSPHKAPVEERRPMQPVVRTPVTPPKLAPAPATEPVAVVSATPEALKPLPGVENAGKPGYYTVKPGDKLIRIALDNGQNWRDLARWNAIENPNVIEVGQVLRVVPPGVDPNAVATNAVALPKPELRPLAAKPATAVPAAPAASAVAAPAVAS